MIDLDNIFCLSVILDLDNSQLVRRLATIAAITENQLHSID